MTLLHFRAAMSQRAAGAELGPFDPAKFYGVRGLGHYAAPVGEPGNATGFLLAVLCTIDTQAVSAVDRTLLARASSSPLGGYSLYTTGAHATAKGYLVSGTPAAVWSSAYTVPASSLGKLTLLCLQLGGDQSKEVRFFANGVNYGRIPIVGYTEAAVPSLLGAEGVTIYEAASFVGSPYLADVSTWASAVRTAGDLSPTLAKATHSHRWSPKVELAKGGVAVADGAPAPAALPDIVTGAPEHQFAQAGGALSVSVGEPEWSYTARATRPRWWEWLTGR